MKSISITIINLIILYTLIHITLLCMVNIHLIGSNKPEWCNILWLMGGGLVSWAVYLRVRLPLNFFDRL